MKKLIFGAPTSTCCWSFRDCWRSAMLDVRPSGFTLRNRLRATHLVGSEQCSTIHCSCGTPRAFNLPLVRLPWPPPLPTSSSAQTHCLLLLVDSTPTSHTPSPSAVPTLLCSPC